MNVEVGLAWAQGELEVYEEHLYTECVQQVVRATWRGGRSGRPTARACCWRPFREERTGWAC